MVAAFAAGALAVEDSGSVTVIQSAIPTTTHSNSLPGGPHDYPFRLNRPAQRTSRLPRPNSVLAAPSGSQLSYYGGRIVSNVQVVMVLWGSGAYAPEVATSVTPNLITQYHNLLASPYMDWLAEYDTTGLTGVGGGTSNQTLGRGTVVGPFQITPSAAANGSTVDDSVIPTEIQSQIQAGNLPPPIRDGAGNPDTYYALFFPPGVTITHGSESSCVQFCAYHNTANITAGEIYFGVHPDVQSSGACGGGCGSGTDFENQSSVASHELIEMATDAEIGLATNLAAPIAWYDNTHGEIGDICNADQGLVVGPDGSAYVAQAEYSNVQHACVVSAPVAVAQGQTHACALLSSGAVECWGDNSHGQLGNGTTTSSLTPVAVGGLGARTIAIAAGGYNTCALSSAGAVHCWGDNSNGQLGNNSTTSSSSAVQVNGLTSGIVAISVGGGHACALGSDGSLKCWGLNQHGQLGINSTANALVPAAVTMPYPGVMVSAGAAHTCAIVDNASTSGDVLEGFCWGLNANGQLGIGNTSDALVPALVSVPSGTQLVSVAAGSVFTCWQEAYYGNPLCSGDNSAGELGTGDNTSQTSPVAVTGLASGNTAFIAAATEHACAIDKTGIVRCWGLNGSGQLGNGSNTNANSPQQVSGLSANSVHVSAGASSTCAASGLGGAVTCWGNNINGQLGNGNTTSSNVPVAAGSLTLYPLPQSQSITFATIPTTAFSGTPLTVTASASSSLPVVLATQTPGTCTVSGTSVTLHAAGPCTLQADQPGDPTHAPADQVVQTFTISKGSQTITFGAAPSLFVGGTATVSATASSGGPVTFGSLTTSICSVSGAIVSGLAQGTCTIQATQVGTANYLTASATQNITVAQGTTPQTITFGTAPSIRVGTSGSVTATGGGSGNPVTFSSLTTGVCSDVGATVTGVTAGTCTIQASQAGNATYASATATQSFAIAQGTQTISFGTAPALTVGATASITVSGGASGNPVVLSSSTTGICTVAGVAVTGVSQGTCTLLANQAGNANYSAAPQAGLSLTVGPAISNVTPYISAGDAHTCGLSSSGGVVCWGSGGNGALGNGSTAEQDSPVVPAGMSSGVQRLASGGYHACVVTSAGAMYCWGNDSQGQLGDKNTSGNISHTSAVPVSGLGSGVASIAGGLFHTCAIKTDSSLYCWGYNFNGQVGDNSTTSSNVPAGVTIPYVNAGSTLASVSAGANASCAVDSAGILYCWGAGPLGTTGYGVGTNTLTPVAQYSGISAVTIGQLHMCVISGGAVYCWGDNSFGQLGSGSIGGSSDTAVAVTGISDTVTGISTAPDGYHTCAVTAGGAAWCWGANAYGMLGNGTTNDSGTPVRVSGLSSGVAQVTAGYAHSCALLSAGGVQCWGDNSYGTLGTGTHGAGSSTPLPVVGVGGTGTLSLTAAPPKSQTISFAALPARSRGQSVALSATASSGLAVAFSSLTPTVCSVGGTTASLILDGTCTIAANQAGNASYSAAVQVTQNLTVLPVPGDLDRSGRSALAWTNSNGTAAAWLVNGGSQLGSQTYGPYAGWTLRSTDSDFNKDGKADMVWTNPNGAVSIWLMNGLTPSSQVPIGPFSGWQLVSANADFDGDGNSDLLWWNATTGQASIWLMNGTSPKPGGIATYGPFAGWTVVSGNNDFDGDGRSDLLWRNGNGAVAIWLMNGLTMKSAASFGPYAGWSIVSGDADYDGNGTTDLLWSNTNGQIAIWLMNGTSVASSATYAPPAGWTVLPGKRDFNGDGKCDLLWTSTSGAAAIWIMNGTSVTAQAAYGPFPGWSVAGGRGDYNGDGNTDLLWLNANGQAALWLMNGVNAVSKPVFGPFSGWSAVPAITPP